MDPAIRSDEVAAAVARLTGDPGRKARHGTLFRIKVVSNDGKPATVNVEVDTHRTECRPYVLNQIADCLRLDRDKLVEALDSWSDADLRRHLETFTQEELKPPFYRKG